MYVEEVKWQKALKTEASVRAALKATTFKLCFNTKKNDGKNRPFSQKDAKEPSPDKMGDHKFKAARRNSRLSKNILSTIQHLEFS